MQRVDAKASGRCHGEGPGGWAGGVGMHLTGRLSLMWHSDRGDAPRALGALCSGTLQTQLLRSCSGVQEFQLGF